MLQVTVIRTKENLTFRSRTKKLDRELTIVINGAQESFIATNWYITAAATLLGGVLAYF